MQIAERMCWIISIQTMKGKRAVDKETIDLLESMYNTCKLLRQWKKPFYDKMGKGKILFEKTELNLMENSLKKTIDLFKRTGEYSPFFDPDKAALMAEHMTFGDPGRAMKLVQRKAVEGAVEVAKQELSKWDLQWLALQNSRKNFSVMFGSLGSIGTGMSSSMVSGIGGGLLGISSILALTAVADSKELDDPPTSAKPPYIPQGPPVPAQPSARDLALMNYFGYLLTWLSKSLSILASTKGDTTAVSVPLTFLEHQGK